ncbi:MAG: iron-sulfur cluster carrier protein ApbC [Aeromicrobium sp.]|nr:MAG: iron-sulfur cluster carrier protein ApbC [Aeromicrobium sp.]
MADVTQEQILTALAQVQDPEIRRPITELGMVDAVTIDDSTVTVRLLLTVEGCPLKDTLNRDITAAVGTVTSDHAVVVEMGVMTEEQRKAMREYLRGNRAEAEIPFTKPGSLTRVYAVASGKGGVGKSSLTVNLATAMALRGLKVGIIDADIYGHSIPDMFGLGDQRPTQVDDMIMPVPAIVGDDEKATPAIKVMSMGMLKPRREQVIAWRGPMLDRALVQMLSDVFWGDLDALFLDLPPGTGDMAISLGQHLPNAEFIVVTTPQQAAAQVAERSGTMASMMHQRVVGVVENMSHLVLPDGTKMEIFGSGGGETVATGLTQRLGYDVKLLAQVPLEETMREGGDSGKPIVISNPDSPAAKAIQAVADGLSGRSRGLAGMQLGLAPAGRL